MKILALFLTLGLLSTSAFATSMPATRACLADASNCVNEVKAAAEAACRRKMRTDCRADGGRLRNEACVADAECTTTMANRHSIPMVTCVARTSDGVCTPRF